MTEPPIPDLTPQVVFPELDDLEPLFSNQEEIQSEALTRSLIPSPSATSAPLLSNPSLTDTLSNFPLFYTNEPRPLTQIEQPQETIPSRKRRTMNRHHFPCNQAALVEEDDHEVELLTAKISAPLPQAEAPRLLGNQ